MSSGVVLNFKKGGSKQNSPSEKFLKQRPLELRKITPIHFSIFHRTLTLCQASLQSITITKNIQYHQSLTTQDITRILRLLLT